MIKSSDYNHKLYEIAKEGTFGNWKLKKEIKSKFEISKTYNFEEGLVVLDTLIEDYSMVVLYHDYESKLITMDDSPWEQDSYIPAIKVARGDVLSCGQGVGLFPVMLESKLKSGEVTSLDIVELDKDVISLTWDYTKKLSPNISLIIEDAWQYLKTSSKKYDLIFWDIGISLLQVIVEGPKVGLLTPSILKPEGRFMYWGQEIGKKLSLSRGTPNYGNYGRIPCRTCGLKYHSNLYGGLCMECADEYEDGLYGDDEVHANGRLSETLQSLGYKILKPKLSEYDIADIVVEGAGKKYLVECKTHLTSSAMFKEMERKIFSYSPYKNEYSGLKLLVYGNAKPELVLKLGKFIQFQGLADWVEILFGGEPVM